MELTSQQGYTKLRIAPEAVKFVYEHDGVTTVYVDAGAALDVAESVEKVEQLRETLLRAREANHEHARVEIRNKFSAARFNR